MLSVLYTGMGFYKNKKEGFVGCVPVLVYYF
jgi:hypothetical protein